MGGVLGPLGAGLECEVRVVPVVLRLEERRRLAGGWDEEDNTCVWHIYTVRHT